MSQEPQSSSSIASQLAEFASKALKPGGVGLGGAYGLWALFIEADVAKAIASTLIGFCFSYAGKLLEPIHQGNQRRLQGAGQTLDQSIDGGIEQLLATATRAEDAYLICQALDCRDYKPEGMGARDRVFVPVLDEVFVPLDLDMSSIPAGIQRWGLRTAKLQESQQIWDFLADAERVPAYRQLAIVAWGGYGKTTLLKYLAYIHGTEKHRRFKVPFRVPILLPLRSHYKTITGDTPPDLPALIMTHHLKSLVAMDARLSKLPANWAQNLLTKGDALVLMDGFDEVPEPQRVALSRWILAQMRGYDRTLFILTSRPKAYRENFVEPLRTQLWVRPLLPEQQAAFVKQWYFSQEKLARGGRNTPEVAREAARNAESLIQQIQDPQRPELGDLAKIPLLLNLLATYHRSNPGVRLPSQRAELYQDICTLQLRKRPEARDIAMPLSHTDRQKVLQTVALTLMQSTLKLIPEDDLVQLIAETLQAQEFGVNAQEFLNQIIDVSELIVRQGLEGCEFAHLSFQEFLAAAEIKAQNQESLLYPHLQDANHDGDDRSWWRPTILLYAAQTKPTRLIQEALRQGAPDLAYACWQETQHTLDPQTAAELEALKPTLKAFRYAKLEKLLQAGEWKKADGETYRLMITTVGKEEGQGFNRADFENFPCEDLKTLNQLWVSHSNGRFGFSVQKKIWQECGSPATSGKDWDRFCIKVGWQTPDAKSLSNYSSFKFHPEKSPAGELPRLGFFMWYWFLFSRAETCEL